MQKEIKTYVSLAINTMGAYNSVTKERIAYLKALISMKNDNNQTTVERLEKALRRPVQITSCRQFEKDVLIEAIAKGDLMVSFNLSEILLNEQIKLILTAYRNDKLAFLNSKNKKKVLSMKETFLAIDNAKGVLYV